MQSPTALFGATALAAALIVASPRLSLSPGPLTAGHGKLANDCLACHTPFRGLPTAKCIACHPLDSIGVAPRNGRAPTGADTALAGLHKSFANTNCLECHSDHAGPDPANATIAFSHEALSSDFRQHCTTCHDGNRPVDTLHQDLDDDCAACHTTDAWKPATFEHDRYFVLDRDHNATCRTCHTDTGNYRSYTCYGCHEHSESRMLAKHREEGVSNLRDCVRCHTSASEHEGGREGGREGRREHDDDDD